ncbi:MAG: hypothetical protein IKX59_05480 [Bacteroidales bacterium]|nr:hypothetical protein [Bacteroidales bacterium]
MVVVVTFKQGPLSRIQHLDRSFDGFHLAFLLPFALFDEIDPRLDLLLNAVQSVGG